MFVTSASEVAGPGISNLLFAFFDRPGDSAQVLIAESAVSRQLNRRLEHR
jgi:hypothetical protein